MTVAYISFRDLDLWDQRFLTLAHHIRYWSKDPNKKVGAVLAGEDKRQVALGVNGAPPGYDDDYIFSLPQAQKNKYMLHAERNVLDNAHFPIFGSTLYTTRSLCPNCALSAVSMNVGRVVMPPPEPDSSWFTEQREAFLMIEGRVDLTLYGGRTYDLPVDVAWGEPGG